jgi:hypothetical protein
VLWDASANVPVANGEKTFGKLEVINTARETRQIKPYEITLLFWLSETKKQENW